VETHHPTKVVLVVQVEAILFKLVHQLHTLAAEAEVLEALVLPVPVDQVVGEQVAIPVN
jgi:hypothetical protein